MVQDGAGGEPSLEAREDLASPGETLLTPAAGAAADRATLRRIVLYKVVTFGNWAIPVQRLQLRRR